MRQLITIIITALLAWLASYSFAWWMVAVISFLIAVVWQLKPGWAFVNGFLSIGLLWLYLILRTDIANEQILSNRIAQLFGLGHTLFIVVNIVLGGLVGGLGGWSGASIWKIFKRKQAVSTTPAL